MKTIKLSIEQAKELYNTNKEFRNTILHDFTDSELGIEPILKNWEDLNFNRSFFVNNKGDIGSESSNIYSSCHLNVPTEKHAKSMIAFAKLSMLIHDLGDTPHCDWWRSGKKYTIEVELNNLIPSWRHPANHCFLAFKTESIRDAFLRKHKRLIKDYFMID